MHWEHGIDIDAPPEQVWALTLDVEALPDLSPTTMTRVRRLDPGPLRPGSRVRVRQPAQPTRTWTVEVVQAPHRFVWATRLGLARMTATHLVEPAAGGSRNRLRLDLSGPGAGLLGRLAGRRLAQVLALENAGFKRLAEQRHAATGQA